MGTQVVGTKSRAQTDLLMFKMHILMQISSIFNTEKCPTFVLKF